MSVVNKALLQRFINSLQKPMSDLGEALSKRRLGGVAPIRIRLSPFSPRRARRTRRARRSNCLIFIRASNQLAREFTDYGLIHLRVLRALRALRVGFRLQVRQPNAR